MCAYWSHTTASKGSPHLINSEFVATKGCQTYKEVDQGDMWRCTILRKSCLYPILLMLVPSRNVHFHGTYLQNSFHSPYVHILERVAGQQSPPICGPGLPSLFYTHSALPGWSSSSGDWRCFQISSEAAKIKKHVPENELSVTSEISPYPSLGPLLFNELWGTFIQLIFDLYLCSATASNTAKQQL